MQDVLKINDLEQLRLLADPLKLDIVQALAEGERTAAEVAANLSEPVTKLYRHIDALLDAGLIEVARERRKRGTIERHFRAAARRFEVEQSLLSADSGSDDVRAVLRSAEDEIAEAIRRGDDEGLIVTRLRLKASPERIAELQAELADWLERMQTDDDAGQEEWVEAGALVAFYRIAPDS